MPEGVASEKRNGSRDAAQAVHAADRRHPQRNEHEGQHDDQDALEQVRPGRGDQTADEAVEDEHRGHRDHDLVDGDRAAGRLADDLAGPLQHAARVDDEVAQRKDHVDGAHPGAVTILGELRHRRAPDPPEDWRHQPVERGDEEVLPLEPDGGGADAVDGAGERHRHLGMRADAKALPNHQPGPEAAPAEEILAAVADPVSRDQADGGDDDEVDDDDDPVETMHQRALPRTIAARPRHRHSRTDVARARRTWHLARHVARGTWHARKHEHAARFGTSHRRTWHAARSKAAMAAAGASAPSRAPCAGAHRCG